MNDKTEFSFDVTLNQAMSHRAAAPTLWAFDDCKAYPLPDSTVLIRNPYNGRSAIIMPEVLSALSLCREFRSLEEHVARVEEGMPQLRGQADEIGRVLEAMQLEGMLVSADDVLAGFDVGAAEQDPEDLEPAVVVITTWERPEALSRLLASIDEHGDPASVATLYVVDDSRTAEHIEKNRQIVEAFSGQSPVDARYFGREQQQSLLSSLAERVPEHEESLRFLADAERWSGYWTSGLARNFALLLSVGKRLVMLDDDALFQVYEWPDHSPGVSLATGLREAEFFDEPGAWPGMRRREDTDPVRAHLECLGLTFGAALGKLGGGRLSPSSLAGSTPGVVRDLPGRAMVLATQCGTVGDPGTGSNTWLIEVQGRSRERMLQSEDSVRRAISNHNAWVGRSRAQLSGCANMSLVTGLDNREALPPYFPALRGEDRLFGSMLSYLFPESAALDYPWAAPHLPVEDRDRARRETDFSARPSFPRFFLEWVQLRADRSQAGSYAQRLEKLAGLYAELAGMSDEELTELYRDEQSRSACSTLVELQSALENSEGAPENWLEYLSKGRQKVNDDLVESFQGTAIRGQPRGVEGRELISLWRSHWSAFDRALKAWPQIRDASTCP